MDASTEKQETTTATEAVEPVFPEKKRKVSNDDDDDFAPLDAELQAYVAGGQLGADSAWDALLLQDEIKQQEITAVEETLDEEEEGEEEELGEDETSLKLTTPEGSVVSEDAFAWHPPEDGELESDEESRKRRRYLIGTHSFLDLEDPGLEDALLLQNEGEHLGEDQETPQESKTQKEDYEEECQNKKVTPSSRVLRCLKSRDPVLNLSRNGLNAEGVVAVCKVLQNNTHVKSLDLSFNAAGAEGGEAIAQLIENNYTITHLNLASTEIVESIDKVAAAAAANVSIISLDLSQNEINDDDMLYVSQLIADNESIRELYLNRNDIGDLGLNRFGNGFGDDTKCEVLELSHNKIRGTRCPLFFESCAYHPRLRHLNLMKNAIGNKGANGVSQILAVNDKIEYLNLFHNCMEDAATNTLANGLKKLEYPGQIKRLTELYLGIQWSFPSTGVGLLRALCHESLEFLPIKILDFGPAHEVDDNFIKAKERALKTHPHLQVIHGSTYGAGKAKGPDPKTLVIKRAKIVCDTFETPLGMLIDELRTEPPTMDSKDFKKFIKSCNLYKDKVMTESFEKVFATSKSPVSDIDCAAIIATYDKVFPKRAGYNYLQDSKSRAAKNAK